MSTALGPFSTIPIEGNEPVIHDQLPSLEEAKMNKHMSQNNNSFGGGYYNGRRKWVIRILVSLVLVIAIIVIAVSSRKHSIASSDNYKEPSGAERLIKILNFVRSDDISGSQPFEDSSSPQYKAALWMASNDPLKVPLSSPSKFIQRYAIVVVHYALDGDINGWGSALRWLSGKSECYWEVNVDGVSDGIECNTEGQVTRLTLSGIEETTGHIPKEIGLLTSMEFLDLSTNQINGTLPVSLTNMTNLKVLRLNGNHLSGSLPVLTSMPSLQAVALSVNHFTGPIPVLSNLTNLVEVGLDQNFGLTGQLDVFYNLSKLQKLYVDHMELTGTLSDKFFLSLPALEEFLAGANQFTSSIPSSIFRHPKLQMVDLHANQLTGTIPDVTAVNSTIKLLALYNNSLIGAIPSSIASLKSLTYLDLSNNDFNSTLPTFLGNLTALEYLFMIGNNFDSGPIPTEYGNLVQLTDLSLQRTNRKGGIPDYFGSKLTNLVLLDLSYNKLEGSIPSLTNATDLLFLQLNQNYLIHSAVQPIIQLTNLAVILLDHNELTGSFDGFCNRLETNPHRAFFTDCSVISCSCCQCCEQYNATCNNGDWRAPWVPLWEFGLASRGYYAYNGADVAFTVK